MLNIILFGIVIYLGYKLYKGFVKKEDKSTPVRGKQKNRPLDLKDSDVEDAHFEDIDEREQ